MLYSRVPPQNGKKAKKLKSCERIGPLEITGLVSFRFWRIFYSCFRGIAYYRAVAIVRGSLLSGDRFCRGIAAVGGTLLSGDRYCRKTVTVGDGYGRGIVSLGAGGSILSSERYCRGS